jgi:hypothetical protein
MKENILQKISVIPRKRKFLMSVNIYFEGVRLIQRLKVVTFESLL